MPEDISSPEYHDLMSRVLRPGNMVWGTTVFGTVLGSVFSGGIKTASEANASGSLSPNWISLAMLSRESPPWNYFLAAHDGPRYGPSNSKSRFHLAVICNNSKIATRFSNQVFAVGGAFREEEDLLKRRFDFQKSGESVYDRVVYGIPVSSAPYEIEPWCDEVRVYPPDRNPHCQLPILLPDLWQGIVIFEGQRERILSELEKFFPAVKPPVFTAEELLAMV